MSCHRPGSSSLMKTPAVMCIAETRAIPSCTFDFATASATVSVTRTSSRFCFVSNQRYSVRDFMRPSIGRRVQTRPDASTLLDAVATFLLEEVQPKLKDDKALSFRMLIAANLVNIVAPEVKTQDERFSHEARRLKGLMPGVADEAKLWSSRTKERT